MNARAQASTRFALPDRLSARQPPEARGLARDEVRLLVARGGTTGGTKIVHARFTGLTDQLEPGDLIVVNTSATLPAALSGLRADGRRVEVHVSGPVADQVQIIELRTPEGERVTDARTGERIVLDHGESITLRAAHPDQAVRFGSRLWQAVFPGCVRDLLMRHGRPISYGYLDRSYPLADYQTVFADTDRDFNRSCEMASAEMASAGRPFSDRLVSRLVSLGIRFAPIMLHTGVSSLEADETPLPERYEVSRPTAELINLTREQGHRIIATGTTVTRAIESAAAPDGRVSASAGWTDLVIGPDRPVRAVGGLITGWHEPQASHLLLLEAVAGTRLVQQAYTAALEQHYLWHEFGDSALFLPQLS